MTPDTDISPNRHPTAARAARLAAFLLAFSINFITTPLFASDAGVAHDMLAIVLPDSGEIRVNDTIRIAEATSRFEFVLNAGLTVETTDGAIEALASSRDGLRKAYRVTLQTASDTLKLHYHGRPRFSARTAMAGMPAGVIDTRGVYLDRSSAWYPQFDRDIERLDLQVELPAGWESISIGGRHADGDRVRWSTDRPHDDIYLIAGPFQRHLREHGGIDLSVWLLQDEPALASRYLDLMGGYIDHYSALIGGYPYAKFAVVENHWQTGYGMPSFTLLGSRVLRLPFIPYTSLPHEILHNWWGNGVWVDYAKGNWSEGLTAYLADHWMKEREGKGAEYRLKALQRYSNFAAAGDDMPLTDFVSRHNDASQSIGYSKSMMLFHMLRRTLGDQAFTAALQRVWDRHRFSRVGFRQVLNTLLDDDQDRIERFLPWIERPGAPRLALQEAEVGQTADGWQLRLRVVQQQQTPFDFDLPIAITTADHETVQHVVRIDRASHQLQIDLAQRPLRVDIDPRFDVLRHLDATEQPPALNRLFGGERVLLVLPADAPPGLAAAWQALASAWQQRYPGLQLVSDTDRQALNSSIDRLILGWDNRRLPASLAAFGQPGQTLTADALRIDDEVLPAADHGIVLVTMDAQGVSTGFIGAGSVAMVQALGRKLPHYGSFGRLVFDGESLQNLRRDTLSSAHSQLTRQFGEQPVALRLAEERVLGPAE